MQVAIAVIERRGRFLICRRRPGKFLGGYWEFPGGKRRAGEPWLACLRRELREELGVSVRVVRAMGLMRYRYPNGTVVFRVYRCAIIRGRPRPIDAQALRWVPARDFGRYRFPPADRPLLARLNGGSSSPPVV